MLTAGKKALCLFYGAVSLAALIATWSQNLAFLAQPDNGGALGFIQQSMANPAAASLSYDLLFVCLAAFAFMLVEARRLGIRYVWVYIVLSMAVAISVMFPLYLIAREIRLAARSQ